MLVEAIWWTTIRSLNAGAYFFDSLICGLGSSQVASCAFWVWVCIRMRPARPCPECLGARSHHLACSALRLLFTALHAEHGSHLIEIVDMRFKARRSRACPPPGCRNRSSASLAEQQLFVAAFEFVHDVAHLFRAEELRLLDVDQRWWPISLGPWLAAGWSAIGRFAASSGL